MLNRREMLKFSSMAAAADVPGVLSSKEGIAGQAKRLEINIAGYDYDRVRAIVDGQVGLPGTKVVFDFQDIYKANELAFGIVVF